MDNPKKRYSIGEMSVVTGVSISTLRYYDKEKILTPAVRNEKSGYRYYSAKQLDLLHCIKFLQSFGFTLEDIRTFLDNHDYDWMEKTMEDNVVKLKKEIEDLQKQVKSIEALVQRMRQGRLMQNELDDRRDGHPIEITTLKKTWVLSTRKRSKLDADVFFLDRCMELQRLRNENNLFTAGPYIAVFHDGYEKQFNKQEGDLEVCVPVFKEEGQQCRYLREFGGELAVGTVHVGSYRTMRKTYDYLVDWINNHGYEIIGPSYEYYYMDVSTESDEAEFITKIYFPVK
ncbi:MAG: MerR family transcriptional regulator [Firmicutes bacterium]|nr:MerR family transcriptional regulator [Bacillota bacterium]